MNSRPGVAGLGYNTAVKLGGMPILRMWYPEEYEVDKATGNLVLFPQFVDIGPMVVRRSAWLEAGGLDENFGYPGQSGIMSDWQLSHRLWLAGYRVTYLYAPLEHRVAGVGMGITRQVGTLSNSYRDFNQIIGHYYLGHVMRATEAHVHHEVKRNSFFLKIGDPLFGKFRPY